MFRKILVPVRNDGMWGDVFAHALAMAKRYDAHIEATHCRPRPSDMLPFGVPMPGFLKDQLFKQMTTLANEEESTIRQDFANTVEAAGLKITDGPNGGGVSVSWVEEQGKQVDVIKHHGRLADLIAVAKPDYDRNLGANTLKSALFHTGRPVMMCPPTGTEPATLGEHITIAWNGSTEASRAVALTLDLISKAKTVTILSAGDEPHGATSEQLIAYLKMREIEAELVRFTPARKIGEELLERTQSVGGDLMIMGAYSNSHESEVVFGGNTQVVVDNATIPIVLVH